MTAWDDHDLRALHQIGAGLGSFQVIKIEENHMTEQTEGPAEQAPWDTEPETNWDGSPRETAPAAGGVYPDHPYKLADHVYTWSQKFPDDSMMVIRAQSAEELADRAEALTAVSSRLAAAWRQVSGGGAPAPQMPFQGQQTAATPPPFGPNASAPAAPGYVGPPVQQQPQQQSWGGAPQGGGLPAGWYRLNVPFAQKGTFDGIVTQCGLRKGDPFKGGQVSWRKEQKFWACAPEVAQAFAQFAPVPA